jgi:hypothetical protein
VAHRLWSGFGEQLKANLVVICSGTELLDHGVCLVE